MTTGNEDEDRVEGMYRGLFEYSLLPNDRREHVYGIFGDDGSEAKSLAVYFQFPIGIFGKKDFGPLVALTLNFRFVGVPIH